jgi:CubicO group peptidase (beta-lactamase class C family)
MASNHLAESAEAVGVDPARLQDLFDYAQAEVDEGRLPSLQVALGRHGQLAGLRSVGTAVQAGERKPVSDDTLYCIYSSTKAIVGVAIWALLEDGKLELGERVASIVPAFAGLDKDEITVEQVLLHIGGFPLAPMNPKLWEDRQARLDRMQGWRLNWEPGSRFEYHATSAHWLLVEIIAERTGLDFRDYVRSRIIEPMGLRGLYLGLPDELHARAADVELLAKLQAPDGGWQEVNPDTILHFNLPSQRRAGCPGGGAFATAGDLALFYQTLVNDGATADGSRILKPETIGMATQVRTDSSRHRDTLNDIPVNRGLTVIVAGDDGNAALRGFGSGTSARAFGHPGAGGQIAWGDPESGLSFAFVTNGYATDDVIRKRTRALCTLAAACVR